VKGHGTWLTAKRTGWKIRLKPRKTLRLRKNRKLLIALNSALKPDPIMLGIKTITNGPIFEISSAFLLRHAGWLISFSLDRVITHTLGASNSRAFLTEEPRFRKPG
jgi:hypothetical protein